MTADLIQICFALKTVRFMSNRNPCTLPLQLTPPGTLTAHERFHLVLLCSHPDTVHGFSLRKTQTSTPLLKGSYASAGPRYSITATRADCGYRAPLTPRLHGLISILSFWKIVNLHPIFLGRGKCKKRRYCTDAVKAKKQASSSDEPV